MTDDESRIRGRQWLRKELEKPTKLEIKIARCERACEEAADPDIKIIWAAKVRELRRKNPRVLGGENESQSRRTEE